MAQKDVDSVESFEMDMISEESEEDDEEEVFVKNGKNSYENGSAKKPLIKGSKKNGKRKIGMHTEIRNGKPTARRCCGPICCVLLGIKSVMGIAAITIVLTNYFTHSHWLWTDHEIFALTCQADLDDDGVTDCLAGGRAGVFLAVSIKTGTKIWDFGDHAIKSDLMSVYAAQFIEDLDRDGVQDVLAVHGGDGLSDPAHDNMYGRIILFSGRDGKLLRWMATPDRRESYYPPQVTTGPDGRQIVIYGTGGNLNNGALYAISLLDLYRKNVSNTRLIYRDPMKGILTPASLVDVTGDGVQDIILATMNSNVMAFDGMNFECIWNKTFNNFESVTSVAVGLFDNDDTPDIIVKYNYGDGFPIYQYEQTMVLSGKNGSIISDIPIDTIATQSSPLAISLEGIGNDMFLHWSSNCIGKPEEKIRFEFRAGTHVHEQSRADICRAMFDTGQISRLMAVSRKLGKFGAEVYNSSYWAKLEHENAVNTSFLANQYLKKHPEIEESLENNEDEYSVLPYKNKNFENALKLLEEEMAREYAGGQSFIDPGSLAYSEGNDEPVLVNDGIDYEQADNDSDQVVMDEKQFKPNQQLFSPGQPVNPAYPRLSQRTYQNPNMQGAVYGQPIAYQPIPNNRPMQVPQPQIPNIPYGPYVNQRPKRQVENYSKYQGVHRQSATGTLAPSLIVSNDTIDLVFPTFWIYPPKVDVLQQVDITCIKNKLKEAKEKTKINEDSSDFEQLRVGIEEDCLKSTNHFAKPDAIYETPSDYDPLSINMGQLIVYRFTLRCRCDESKLNYGERCSSVLPYSRQGWPAYMGTMGDSIYRRGGQRTISDQNASGRR